MGTDTVLMAIFQVYLVSPVILILSMLLLMGQAETLLSFWSWQVAQWGCS